MGVIHYTNSCEKDVIGGVEDAHRYKGWMEMYRIATWREMGEGPAFKILVKGTFKKHFLQLVQGRVMYFVID